MYVKISIHAPTRGATSTSITCVTIFSVFQSTLPREERLSLAEEGMTPAEFQSTLPREERPRLRTICKKHTYFNPRSHERSDDNLHSAIKYIRISIHAPTRGATNGNDKVFARFQFQSTLPREERHIPPVVKKFLLIFQSTLPREERLTG